MEHPASVPALADVLRDTTEHRMVRHEVSTRFASLSAYTTLLLALCILDVDYLRTLHAYFVSVHTSCQLHRAQSYTLNTLVAVAPTAVVVLLVAAVIAVALTAMVMLLVAAIVVVIKSRCGAAEAVSTTPLASLTRYILYTVNLQAAEALGAVGGSEVEQLLASFAGDAAVVVKESCEVALDTIDYWKSSSAHNGAHGIAAAVDTNATAAVAQTC
jgi:hypothetical protein